MRQNCPKCSLVKRIGDLKPYKSGPGLYCVTCGHHIDEPRLISAWATGPCGCCFYELKFFSKERALAALEADPCRGRLSGEITDDTGKTVGMIDYYCGLKFEKPKGLFETFGEQFYKEGTQVPKWDEIL